MRWLLKRWWSWLAIFLLLGLSGSAVLIYANPSRITQENLDRIQDGMTLSEVEQILGKPSLMREGVRGSSYPQAVWRSGPNLIVVDFNDDHEVRWKGGDFSTSLETLQWYARRIGINWH
ncbi:MAG TPA: outer membrane protein assembly factor BamE [Gemmataceae bacterium]|jgi:hypothetical protein|nr:outer membrane protein assembly factor BamE [Gemmataceae bacterium]